MVDLVKVQIEVAEKKSGKVAASRVRAVTPARMGQGERREFSQIADPRKAGLDGTTVDGSRSMAATVARQRVGPAEQAASRLSRIRRAAFQDTVTGPARSALTSRGGAIASAFSSGAARAGIASKAAMAAGVVTPAQLSALFRTLGGAGATVAAIGGGLHLAADWLPFLAGTGLLGSGTSGSAIADASVAQRAMSGVSAGFDAVGRAQSVMRGEMLLRGATRVPGTSYVSDPVRVKTLYQGIRQFDDAIRLRYSAYEANLIGTVVGQMSRGQVGTIQQGW